MVMILIVPLKISQYSWTMQENWVIEIKTFYDLCCHTKGSKIRVDCSYSQLMLISFKLLLAQGLLDKTLLLIGISMSVKFPWERTKSIPGRQ